MFNLIGWIMLIQELPEEVEAYRDRSWRREPEFQIEDALAAERLSIALAFALR